MKYTLMHSCRLADYQWGPRGVVCQVVFSKRFYKTAWQLDQGLSIASEAIMRKALVSDLCRHVTGEAIQIHDGFGFAEKADPQLYYRRAAVAAVLRGSAIAFRVCVASTLGRF